MCEVICHYKDKCSSFGKQCHQCKRNTGKRDYYDPDWTPWYPYQPYYPYITYWWRLDNATAPSNNIAPMQITCQNDINNEYYQPVTS